MTHGIVGSLEQNAVLVAARGDGADFEAVLLTLLEQSHGFAEPVVRQEDILLNQPNVIVVSRERC